jgi:hypothetical protein
MRHSSINFTVNEKRKRENGRLQVKVKVESFVEEDDEGRKEEIIGMGNVGLQLDTVHGRKKSFS